jgi:hypothetical protein
MVLLVSIGRTIALAFGADVLNYDVPGIPPCWQHFIASPRVVSL